MKVNKDKRICIRVNTTEYNIIKRVANMRKTTVSSLLISLAKEECLRLSYKK